MNDGPPKPSLISFFKFSKLEGFREFGFFVKKKNKSHASWESIPFPVTSPSSSSKPLRVSHIVIFVHVEFVEIFLDDNSSMTQPSIFPIKIFQQNKVDSKIYRESTIILLVITKIYRESIHTYSFGIFLISAIEFHFSLSWIHESKVIVLMLKSNPDC